MVVELANIGNSAPPRVRYAVLRLHRGGPTDASATSLVIARASDAPDHPHGLEALQGLALVCIVAGLDSVVRCRMVMGEPPPGIC